MTSYKTVSRDTNEDVERILIEAWRRMPPAEKIRRVSELSRAMWTYARAGLRLRHPTVSEEELDLRLATVRLGEATMKDVFGFVPDA